MLFLFSKYDSASWVRVVRSALKVDVCLWCELRSRKAGRHFLAKPIGACNRRRTLVPSKKKVRAPPLHLPIQELQQPRNDTMAPTKPSSKGGKGGNKGKPGSGTSSKKSSSSKSFTKPKPSSETGISKRKQKSMALARPGGAQKTKTKTPDGKKKRRVYSEKELDIPTLNGIVPAGVAKPKGQKIGKKFVDDPASMMAIMSMVNAEKEGHIESKIMRARQLEEVREAKRREAEERSEEKKAKFVS
jgi:60S ribosomal subunit assembly/export protein LOC1